MSAPHAKGIADGYLRRLEDELRTFPRRQREEILQEIREHISSARELLSDETDADLLNVLDRLGAPETIASDARERFGIKPVSVGISEAAGLLLLIFGGFVVPILPVLAALPLVWRSSAWSRREKRIATVALSPVLLLPVLVVVSSVARPSFAVVSGGNGSAGPPSHLWMVVPLVFIVLAPFCAGIYLARRVRKVSLFAGGVLGVLALLITIPTAWAAGIPPRQYGHNQDPSVTAREQGAPAGDAPNTQRPDGSFCRDFYETTDFGPMGTGHENISVCSNGTKVKASWGPDCNVEGFTFITVRCTVEYPSTPRPADMPRSQAFGTAGSLNVRVDIDVAPTVPPVGRQSSSFTVVSVLPDGTFMEGDGSGFGHIGNVHAR